MTGPDLVEQLQRRVAALEVGHFTLVDKLRLVGDTAECTAKGLDELEDALIEMSTSAAGQADEIAAAIAAVAQRQTDEIAAATAAIAQLRAQLDRQAPRSAASAPDVPVPDLATLHVWVQEHLAPLVRKTTTTGEGAGIRWCRSWWAHPDAVQRCTALYLAHQQLSADGPPIWRSVYLRDHLDPHLAVLTSPYGPFHACTPGRHSTATEALGHAELDESLAFIRGEHDEHITAVRPGQDGRPGR